MLKLVDEQYCHVDYYVVPCKVGDSKPTLTAPKTQVEEIGEVLERLNTLEARLKETSGDV